jgi:molybdopterin synthase catalytic subunit
MIAIRVLPEPIDLDVEMARIEALGCGGVASFVGLVRGEGRVTALHLDHYPGMTERVLDELACEAKRRWSLDGVVIVHRVGTMKPGERIVIVVTGARHRGPALEACAHLIDRLKVDAPFWKRESADGDDRWIEARDSDHAAARR